MTRREEYHRKRLRFIRRRNKMYDLGWTYEVFWAGPGSGTAPWKRRVARTTALWSGPKQVGDRVEHGPKFIGPVFGIVEGTHFEITNPFYSIYPVARFIGPGAATRDAMAPSKAKHAAIQYHLRRVKRVGHKPDRMNGFQRKCWGAAYHAYTQGYFPDWDPLARHPTLAEYLLGEEYTGPFPQTPPAGP